MYHLTEAYLMAFYACLLAAYIGALVFGAAAIAPLAVRLLGESAAATLLRSFWLRYHRFAVAAGLVRRLRFQRSAARLCICPGCVGCIHDAVLLDRAANDSCHQQRQR